MVSGLRKINGENKTLKRLCQEINWQAYCPLYQIRFSLTGPSCDRSLVFLERRIQGLACKIGTKIRELDELTRVLNREFSEWENSLRNKKRFSS